MYHSQSNHFPMAEQLIYLLSLAITHGAAVNTCGRVVMWTYIFISLGGASTRMTSGS